MYPAKSMCRYWKILVLLIVEVHVNCSTQVAQRAGRLIARPHTQVMDRCDKMMQPAARTHSGQQQTAEAKPGHAPASNPGKAGELARTIKPKESRTDKHSQRERETEGTPEEHFPNHLWKALALRAMHSDSFSSRYVCGAEHTQVTSL